MYAMKTLSLALCIMLIAPCMLTFTGQGHSSRDISSEGSAVAARAVGDPSVSKIDAHNYNASWSMSDLTGYTTVNLTSKTPNNAMLAQDMNNYTGGSEVKLTADQQNRGGMDAVGNIKGNIVTVWEEEDTLNETPNTNIYGSIIDTASKQPLHSFTVSNGKSNETHPRVAPLPDNGFAVVWAEGDSLGNSAIFLAIFNGTGVKQSFSKVSSGVDAVSSPDVAADPTGMLFVVWEDCPWDDQANIVGHVFNSDGSGTGSNLALGSTLQDERNPAVTSLDKDLFAIIWQRDTGFAATGWDLNATMVKSGVVAPFVAYSGGGDQKWPAIASYPGANLMVMSWMDLPLGAKDKGNISAGIYDSTGDSVVNAFSVANTAWNEREPSVAVNPNMNFTVFWSDNRAGNLDYSVYAKMYDSDGSSVCREIVVCNESNSQSEPAGVCTSDGDWWAAFTDGRSGAGMNIFARKLIHPFFSPGNLTTRDFAPQDLYKWNIFNYVAGPSGNQKLKVDFYGSVDSGSTWSVLEDRENLTNLSVESGKIRFRAVFISPDNETSPTLASFNLSYITNIAPVISAFPANGTVPKNSPFTLTTCATDADGDRLVYRWNLKDASGASLDNYSTASPVFLANHSGSYLLSLNVSDGFTYIIRLVNLTVQNHAPSISGPSELFILKKSSQKLAFSASDSDNDTLTCAWSFGSNPGSGAALNSTTVVSPTLNISLAGSYSLKLVVGDGETQAAAILNVTAVGRPPEVAGPASLFAYRKTDVQLPFNASDPDADNMRFTWSFLSNPNSGASLNDSSCLAPTFRATLAGSYSLKLLAEDVDNSSVAFLNITAAGRPPVVGFEVNRTTVKIGGSVRFDASTTTDPEGDSLQFRFTYGDGTVTDWVGNAASDYVYKQAGTYQAKVEVRDSEGNSSSSSTVLIEVLPAGQPGQNMPPVASLVMKALSANDTMNFTFNSTSFDPDGSIVSTTWDFGDGSRENGTGLVHRYTVSGDYNVLLTVLDNQGARNSTSKKVRVIVPGVVGPPPENRRPLIQGWSPFNDTTITLGEMENYSVTASDPDGDSLYFAWTVNGSAVVGATMPNYSLKPSKTGTRIVNVTVSDAKGLSVSREWTLHIRTPSTPTPPTPPTPPGPGPNPPSAFDTVSSPPFLVAILVPLAAIVAILVLRRRKTKHSDLPPEEEEEKADKPAPEPALTQQPSSMEQAVPPVSVPAARAVSQPEAEPVPDEPAAPQAPAAQPESAPRKTRRAPSIVSVSKPPEKAPAEIPEGPAPPEPEAAAEAVPEATAESLPSDGTDSSAAASVESGAESEEARISAVAAATAPKHRAGPAPKVVATDSEGPGRIEQVFLLYMDGRLISHVSYTGEKKHMDADIFGSMLHAVQSFVKDSFKGPENLSALGFGKKRIMIQRGPQIFLAVVTSGTELPGLKEKMRKVLIAIWDEYREYLKKWNGSTDDLKGLKTILKTAFQ